MGKLEDYEDAKAVQSMTMTRGWTVLQEKMDRILGSKLNQLASPANSREDDLLLKGFLHYPVELRAVVKEFLRVADTSPFDEPDDEEEGVSFRG